MNNETLIEHIEKELFDHPVLLYCRDELSDLVQKKFEDVIKAVNSIETSRMRELDKSGESPM